MTMFCAGMALIIEGAEKYIRSMREEWQREGRDTSDWLIVVFAGDIFICAPPQIAARLYAHIF